MNINKKIIIPFLLICIIIFGGWGQTGHKIINQNVTNSFPPQMNELLYWSSILAQHASDADNRKSSDPTEAPKHFIDIDSYPEFVTYHKINQNYDSVVAMHGSTFVINVGILPWAIIAAYDTLKNCFIRRDWNKAVLVAANLGHYVADSHQPLHITKNYDPDGLHSRYETDMIDRYQSQITYSSGSAQYISNIPDFVFNTIYNNYIYVDSVINAGSIAKTFAGSTTSDVYYQKLWELTGGFTTLLFKSASTKIASLIYTAWTDAGSPLPSGGNLTAVKVSSIPSGFTLSQNFPNPFNPSTIINYSVPGISFVTIKVYDILGKEVATLVNGEKAAGNYQIQFNPNKLGNGVYFYRMNTGSSIISRKLVLLK